MGLSFSALALTLVSVSLAVAGPALVATSSNESSGNRLLIFEVAADGSLAGPESVTTGGSGTGAGLGSQGALALSRDGRWLLVVNAGSDNVSLFEVTASGPVLRDVVPSGGRNPISVAIAGRSVAVLNAGGAVGGRDNITGFVIGPRGRLVRVKGATRPLSGANVGPAQVAFALDGAVAVVTEKATNRIDTFALDAQGAMSGPRVHASAGPTPFGFDVVFGEFLVVSEAAGGAPGASSVSSYQVQGDGGLVPLTSALATGQSAACWTEVTRDGRFGYLTNAAS
ncbi:MAG: hypothetical protein KA760_03695, partial [Steroidobacteraceae bacterium]|nr:hypothetical protein [Steroidobacteraceae bacterium]